MIRDPARRLMLQALARVPGGTIGDGRQEVLLFRPDHLGDVLFLTPGLRRFRRALPGWQITLVVGPWGAPVLAGNDDLDAVIQLPFPGFTRAAKPGPLHPYRLLRNWAGILASRRPAAAVVLRDDHWWGALLAHQSGIPIRVGSRHPSVSPFLTHRVAMSGHSVSRNAALLAETTRLLGGDPDCASLTPDTDPLRFGVSGLQRRQTRDLLKRAGVEGPYCVIHPGSGALCKLWPADRWGVVGAELERRGHQIVVTGSSGEAALADGVARAVGGRAVSLAGQTDLPCLAAIQVEALLVLGVDSGPLHLAAAVSAPTLHIFGPSDPEQFGPWAPNRESRVIDAGLRCARCGDLAPNRPEGLGCMLAVGIDDVIERSLSLLAHAQR